MKVLLTRALPVLALGLVAACSDVPDQGSMSMAPAPATGMESVSRDPVSSSSAALETVSTNVVASPVSIPDAVALRSARLARYGKTFDQAFYDASARRNAADIAKLTQAFLNLGPGVDPEEAQRAAYVVYTYVDQLVVEYEITSGPLAHNTAVNFGTKPRGLCWHWAHDLDDRLQKERFRTLEIHRAIANYDSLRLEHSTTILGRRGDAMEDSIVLDPWRNGGELFWDIVRNDTRYNWTPRDEVFAFKRARKARYEEKQQSLNGDPAL
ncbi:MAG: hypothetical protein RIG84_00040 [Roseovarius sp.]